MAFISLYRPITLLISPTLLTKPKHKLFYRNNIKYNVVLAKKCYSTTTKTNVSIHKLSELEHESSTQSNNIDTFTELELEAMPKHVAIALDGNRRWLKARGRDLNYEPFFDKIMVFVKCCLQLGIPKATSFIWGLGNFTKRSQEANDIFLGEFQNFIEDNLNYFKRKGIKIRAMGETSLLSKSLQDSIKQVEEETRDNKILDLSLPVCYTGQRDITNATRRLCEKVKEGLIEPSDVTEDMIQNELCIPSSLAPDLFIRTGGETRVGALLTWHVSHTELYFTDTLAPDFAEHILVDALRYYVNRDRKFGG